jgi:hypothetical protein
VAFGFNGPPNLEDDLPNMEVCTTKAKTSVKKKTQKSDTNTKEAVSGAEALVTPAQKP